MRNIIKILLLFQPLIAFSQITYVDALQKSYDYLTNKFTEANYKEYLVFCSDSTKDGKICKHKQSKKTGWGEYEYNKYYPHTKNKSDVYKFYYKYLNNVDSNIYITTIVSKDTIDCDGCIDINNYNKDCKIKISQTEAIKISSKVSTDLSYVYLCSHFAYIEDKQDIKNIELTNPNDCKWYCPFKGNIWTYNYNKETAVYVWIVFYYSSTINNYKTYCIDAISGALINN